MNLNAAISSRAVLWTILALPGCYMLLAYARADMVYGAFIHWTGDIAAWLLLLTLALTPVRLLLPGRRWPTRLLQRRRYFGVASFIYALLHVGAYLIRQPGARIADEMAEPGMLTGWIAFAIFLALAATSNDASVRALGRWWKTLHRFVYPAALLTFVHWVMTAFDPMVGVIHLVALAVIEGVRVYLQRRSA